jgi:hypothetical protein
MVFKIYIAIFLQVVHIIVYNLYTFFFRVWIGSSPLVVQEHISKLINNSNVSVKKEGNLNG